MARTEKSKPRRGAIAEHCGPGIRQARKWPRWAPNEIRLLGAMRDSDVSSRTGRTIASVKTKRLSLRIPSGTTVNYWTAAQDAELGTARDEDLAIKFARTLAAVRRRRHTRGVALRVDLRRKTWNDKVFSQFELDLIGKMRDADLAALAGCSTETIRRKRYALRIRCRPWQLWALVAIAETFGGDLAKTIATMLGEDQAPFTFCANFKCQNVLIQVDPFCSARCRSRCRSRLYEEKKRKVKAGTPRSFVACAAAGCESFLASRQRKYCSRHCREKQRAKRRRENPELHMRHLVEIHRWRRARKNDMTVNELTQFERFLDGHVR